MSNRQRIENSAQALIDDFGITSAPVPVQRIAEYLGIKLTRYQGSGVSGVLVIDQVGKATIGYNPTESIVRQRFTIAHELGHYVLHRNPTANKEVLFIDKDFKFQVELRKEGGEYMNPRNEVEANAFAAALLMPEDLLRNESLNYNDLGELQVIKKLSMKFQVSSIAMTYRISNLGLYRSNLEF